MSQQVQLSEVTFRQLLAIFAAFPELEKVKVYGSRAKGTATERSDIDLAVFGEKLNRFKIAEMLLAFDESDIVSQINIQNYAEIKNKALKDHIDRVGVEIYSPIL